MRFFALCTRKSKGVVFGALTTYGKACGLVLMVVIVIVIAIGDFGFDIW